MKKIIFVFAAALLLTAQACQKVINVKLNSSVSQYVFEGNVTNESGPYMVRITKSVDFQQDNNFPAVSGAKVAITDVNTSITDTLREDSAGIYVTNFLQGIPGHTYHLYINIDGQVFTSSSTMPVPINMDSLYQKPAEFGDGVSIVPVYTDPAGQTNYYHFVKYINNKQSDDLYIRGDDFYDGKTISIPLNLGTDTAIHTYDFVTVELQTIDSGVYQFYRTLDETLSQNSASPANPITNITGGKLGYFSAYAVTRKTIQIY